MTKQVQRRRGTATQHTSFTGAEGEISVNTTNKSTHVHDGATAGGIEAARADLVNVSDANLNAALTGNTVPSLTITTVDINGGTIDGTVIGGATAAAVTGTAITGTSFTTTGDMSFGDNDKAIFGAGSDLQIYHDGSHSRIDEQGTGVLFLQTDGTSIQLNKGTSENMLVANVDASVDLYYDNALKISTTATGISVTGTITSDGLTVDGDIHVLDDVVTLALESSNTNGQKWSISSTYTNTGGSYGALIIEDEAGSDWLRFDEGNGSPFSQFLVNGSEAMRIDASGNVGIGTSSPTGTLSVVDSTSTDTLYLESSDTARVTLRDTSAYVQGTGPYIQLQGNDSAGAIRNFGQISGISDTANNGELDFGVRSSGSMVSAMRIDSSGNVGIGTSSPDQALHVEKSVAGGGTELLVVNSGASQSGTYSQIGLGTGGDSTGTAYFRLYRDGSGVSELKGYLAQTFLVNNAERMRIDSSGNVGIGTSSPSSLATIQGTSSGQNVLQLSNSAGSSDGGAENGLRVTCNGNTNWGNLNVQAYQTIFSQNGSERMRIDASGNIGIGTSSPSRQLHVNSASESNFRLQGGSDYAELRVKDADNALSFHFGGLERMRIDASGNVLVGKTSGSISDEGVAIFGGSNKGLIEATRDGGRTMTLNRKTSDGEIIQLRKDGTAVGSIASSNGSVLLSSTTSGLIYAADVVAPTNPDGSARDNLIDLGNGSRRFDDIYATNGTIQTSDRNEKKDIASLTPNEMLVAARLSTGFKNFKWKDKVAEKGDDARLHSGAIAQDVQDAFTAEGLDAGNYAMFISGTWWEHDVDVPAVEVVEEVAGVQAVEAVDYVEAVEATYDEDGIELTPYVSAVQEVEAVVGVEYVEAVEYKDAYTRTDTYDTLEEAPEGSTERTRLGIRYPELLSFVAAYNEQRFASIETRLTALEA